MNQTTNDFKAADTAMSSPLNGESDPSVKRAIEVGFPIVEINRLAVPERNSFKPIYQMHKWFARRASCVFRAILLGTLKPAIQPDGTPTDLMEEFYKDHSNDPDTNDKVILDPFMGGGTTVVEALRLGCRVIGIDLNPVAWFIVKTETEPVDLDALKAAFDRLAARPVAWNEGRPLKETLLNLYKTEVAEGIAADPANRGSLMAGYHLIDERMMKPLNPDGIEPNPNRMGFLDYLRGLREDSFPFPRGHKILVEGLEDVLLAAGNSLPEVERRIHGILTSRANELESIMQTNVQVVFKDKLQKSDDFWLEAGMQKHLSLRRIFGTPRRYRSPNGTEFFIAGFNLT